MAIAFDAASTAKGTTASFTFSHTCTGSNGILIVGIGTNDTSTTPNAVTYNGVALTQLQRLTNVIASELWYLVAPATGAHNIVVGMSAAGQMVVCNAASYTGVHQSVPLGTKVTATGSSTTPSVNVSSAAGELVVDSASQQAANGTATLTVGAGQTQRGNDRQFSAYGVLNGISEEAGAGTVTMSWTGSNSAPWATIGVPLKPTAAVLGAALLGGAGVLTAAGIRTRLGVAALAGAGTLTASGEATTPPAPPPDTATVYYQSPFIDRRFNRTPIDF